MPAKKKQMCPVCMDPVEKDPHEKCLASIKSRQEPEQETPPMPCPACGQEMGQGHDCPAE